MDDFVTFLATGLVIFNLSILLMEPVLFQHRKPMRKTIRSRH